MDLPETWKEEPAAGTHWAEIPKNTPKQDRLEVPTLDAEERARGFEEVRLQVAEHAAQEEAARCLDCGACCECLQCVAACQAGAVVHEMGPVLIEGQPVSSTRVRQLVRGCNLAEARRLLGRHYRIAGRVVSGHGRGGRLLGFPTANLRAEVELLPGSGVYAVLVEPEPGRLAQGVTNIGSNPTFSNGGLTVETHLLDFQGDLYGRDIVLHFVEYLRGERRFESPQELAAQIGRDVAAARELLAPWQAGLKNPQVD